MRLDDAFVVHMARALVGLQPRHTLRLPPRESIRIGFGLAVPMRLFGRVIRKRLAFEWDHDAAPHQHGVVGRLRDDNTGWQLGLLALRWRQGCMGMGMGMDVGLQHRAR